MTVATQVVDVDVHVAPQTVEPLLAHMEPYWADYVANAELRLSPTMNGLYPPVAFLAGEEEGTVQPVPSTLDELRAGLGDDRMAVLNCVTPFDSSHNVYYEAALCSGVNDWLRTEFLERDPRLRGEPPRARRSIRTPRSRRSSGSGRIRGSCRSCCRSAPRRRGATSASTACTTRR